MKLSREVKTAIIVLGGILLTILGFGYLKSQPIFDDNMQLYAVYDHIGGLQTGTQVTINGLNVGTVNNIKFKDKSGKLLVTFSVDKDFRFSKNSRAELYDTGIIGGKGIQIKPVFDDAPMAIAGDTLQTDTRPGLTELVQTRLTPLQQKVEGAVSNADSLLMNFNEVLDGKTKRNLREAINNLNIVVSSFQKSANSLNQILDSNKGPLEKSLSNLTTITDNFSKFSDSLSNMGLSSSLRKLESTMDNLNALVGRIEGGEGSLGKLMKNEELYNNLNNASRELDLLLQDFRLNPKRYVNVSVFGKKQTDYAVPEEDPAQKIDNQ